MMYKCLFGVLVVMTALTTLHSQITFTQSFTKKLERANLEFVEPVEMWLHASPLKRDDFMKYDLVVQNDRNDFEMRFRLRFANSKYQELPQNVEATRMLASITSNHTESTIHVEIPGAEFWQTHFNAHDGMIAHFQPKSSFSEKTYGTLISILSEENAIIDVIILYDDAGYIPSEMFRNLWFKGSVK